MSQIVRADVLQFAKWMEEAMDSKKIERESRNEPAYMDTKYPLRDALDRLLDKVDQLVYWTSQDEQSPIDQEQVKERVKKTAVHLANFCMIIERKIEAGHII